MSANRGRYAEAKIKDFLEEWKQAHAAFTYNRILDAHSAKGMISNPQPGDFQWFMSLSPIRFMYGVQEIAASRNGLIESKETTHQFRLEYHSFGADQVGRMVIRQMAGSECIVLICHRPTPRVVFWRSVPLDFFRERPGPKFGSWDLREFPVRENPRAVLTEYLS